MDRILGQSRAVGVLQAALDSGRVHHAWIFRGPLGVGKFTTAIEFAKVLIDPDVGPDLTGRVTCDPAGDTARRIDADTHPDLHVIRKELALYASDPEVRKKKMTNIPIDVLREFMIGGVTGQGKYHDPHVFLSPGLGRGKVFIIDEAELLGQTGQNALLKTLEEPPAGTYLILVTTREDRLFPTIRSRCQRVAFTPLDETDMRTWLDRALEAPGTEEAPNPFARLDEKRLEWIVRFAAGSPGLAVLAARDGLDEWFAEIASMLRELERGEFPVAMGDTLSGLVERYANAWVKRNPDASKDAANKDGGRRVFMLLGAHARNRLRRAADKGEDPTLWTDVIGLIADAERQMAANVNLKLLFENLVVQWADLVAAPART